ncbi:MAG: transglycosylase domain-containing protein, partial [Rhodobiaceae bacterium]|nr:transglycosylase domain-containing protein [Rhodobiaceae bacterium]
ILKLYFDRAYMGGGAFGVEAASQFYFGKSIRDVTLAEAAMLAGLFKAPTRYAPHVNLPAARARANEVLDNMVEAGFLTEGQVYAARKHPAKAVSQADYYSPDFFLDWAYDEVLRLAQSYDQRVLVVKTTVDTNLQKYADQSVQTILRQEGQARHVKQAAMVSMDTDGAVRAIVGGRDYGESQFNRATQSVRQPGSSFKPFVYLTALMNGYTPESVVTDRPINIGGWTPRNYSGGYVGRITLTNALVRSINTIPVQLAQAIGRGKIVETARKAGLTSDIVISRSLPLGAADLTVMEMTGAYATFASGGLKATPYGVLEIRDSAGNVLYNHWRDAPKREQVLPRDKVEQLNYILSQVVERGTGRRAILEGLKACGKTGTTNGYRNAWFMGFTGKYVTGVWFGNDDYSSTARVTGGSLPAMTWHRYNAYAHQGIEVPDVPGVPGSGTGTDVLAATSDGEDGAGTAVGPRLLSVPTQKLLRAIGDDFDKLLTVASAETGGTRLAAAAQTERPAGQGGAVSAR